MTSKVKEELELKTQERRSEIYLKIECTICIKAKYLLYNGQDGKSNFPPPYSPYLALFVFLRCFLLCFFLVDGNSSLLYIHIFSI
jgi:hypothetical protein